MNESVPTTDHLDRLIAFKQEDQTEEIQKPKRKKRRPRIHQSYDLTGMYEHDKRSVEIWFDKHWSDLKWRKRLIDRVRNPRKDMVV